MGAPEAWDRPTATSPRGTSGMVRITTREYGFPLSDDAALFERLVLEINQAGLSWLTILKKREAFRRRTAGSTLRSWPATARATGAAAGGSGDHPQPAQGRRRHRQRRHHPGAARDARLVRRLADAHHPLPKAEWVKLFKRTFRFTGGEIVGEFLMSVGYLPGAHTEACPVYRRVLARKPMWARRWLAPRRDDAIAGLDGLAASRRSAAAARSRSGPRCARRHRRRAPPRAAAARSSSPCTSSR